MAPTSDLIVAALFAPELSWVTLPCGHAGAPSELLAALDAFDGGKHPAGRAAADWLNGEALDRSLTARTHLLVGGKRVAGFYSLASSQVTLSQRDRRRIDVHPVRVPAALVAWIAKNAQANVDGRQLLWHAAATARRVAKSQATAALVVDPFDERTAMMWRRRFGFRPSAEQRAHRRLWLPLRAVG